MDPLLQKLQGGDRRSIGRVDEVIEEVMRDPALLDVLFEGMCCEDPVVRMRAADATEKITVQHPEYLEPYREMLLGEVSLIEQQEVRWHVAQMVPRLAWGEGERTAWVEILMSYLEDKSRIVKTFAIQALTEFAEQDDRLRLQVIDLLEELSQTGSPAVQSRGRKLLQRLKNGGYST